MPSTHATHTTLTWSPQEEEQHRRRCSSSTSSHPTRIEDGVWVYDNILQPFFRDLRVHQSTPVPTPDTVYMYDDGVLYPTPGSTLNIEGPPANAVVYDSQRDTPRSYTDGPPSNVALLYNRRFVGVLDTGMNILVATDWAHSSACRPFVQAVIGRLAERGLLRTSDGAAAAPPTPAPPPRPQYTITMGCDPEFELVHRATGKVQDARNHIEGITSSHGQVGVDGSGEPAELRPAPGSPQQVIENIRELLRAFARRQGSTHTLAASSDRFECGGHIHIGFSPPTGDTLWRKIACALDALIGNPMHPLNGPIRIRSSYGSVEQNKYREQPWGLEYRAVPAAAFSNPRIAELTLQVAHGVAQRLTNDGTVSYNGNLLEAVQSAGGLSLEEAQEYCAFIAERCVPRHTDCACTAWGITMPEVLRQRTAPQPDQSAQLRRAAEQIMRSTAPPAPYHVEPAVQEQPTVVGLHFSDDWRPEPRQAFTDAMQAIGPLSRTTVLYGLRGERGLAATIPLPGCRLVEHPGGQGDNEELYIGLPYSVRMSRGADPAIVEAVVAHVRAHQTAADGAAVSTTPAPAPALPHIGVGAIPAPTPLPQPHCPKDSWMHYRRPHNGAYE